ncbi:MFS transporter [Ideonella sp. B508-1]|uniref:MFS transporter n=1 Tax=Ideonella sp. B508-1 TaxID=137716 RepID=UPI000A0559D0|nr:MFS transporter [Ideonella sp. B508-1]
MPSADVQVPCTRKPVKKSSLILWIMGAAQLSEAAFRLAVAWWLLRVTKSPEAFGSMVAISNLAMTLSHAFLGWIADRYPRGIVLGFCYALDFSCAISLLLMASRDSHHLVIVALVLVLGTIANSVGGPVHTSLAMEGAESAEKQAFIRHRASISTASMIVGPLLSSALLAWLDAIVVIALHAVVLFACMLTLLRCALVSASHSQNAVETLPSGLRSRLELVFSGIRLIFRIPAERGLSLQSMISNMATFPIFVILVPFIVKSDPRLPIWSIGLCSASFGMGALASSAWLAKRLLISTGRYSAASISRSILFASWCAVLATEVMAAKYIELAHQLHIMSILALLCAGGAFSILNIVVSQSRALATPDSYRNRLISANSALVTATIPVGSYGAGTLLQHVGFLWTLACAVGLMGVVLMLYWLDSPSRKLLALPDSELPEAYMTFLKSQ